MLQGCRDWAETANDLLLIYCLPAAIGGVATGDWRLGRIERWTAVYKKTGLVSQGVTEKPGEFRISTIVGLRRTSAEACTRDQGRNLTRADKEQTAAARKIQGLKPKLFNHGA